VPITTNVCEFEPRSWRGGLDATLCDKVCQWLATGRWVSPGTPVSSTNKTKRHDIAEILLKVALSTINQPTNLSITINVVSSNVARYNMIIGVASIEAKTKIRGFIFRFLFIPAWSVVLKNQICIVI
jgi:hypothetical protein